MELTNAVDKALAELAARKQRAAFFNDPASWAEYMLGMKLWSKQCEVALSVVQNKSVAVKAAHGVGKSHLAAVLICWWIDTRYPKVFVASTAPSQAQIASILWRLVRQFKVIINTRYKAGLIDHDLPGYITSDNQWKETGGNILGFGRKPPENKEDTSFQGLHDAYVLAVGDEAVGLTESMIDALGNITSNSGSRRLLILNPTNPASYVGKLFKEQSSNWTFHTISVFDSPNFNGGDGLDPEALEKLVDQTYVDEKKAEYGENTPRYKSRVLGEFAYDLGDTLIKPEDIATAYDTVLNPETEPERILGCDVARFGQDYSTIYSNLGGKVQFVAMLDHSRVTETANWLHRYAVDLNAAEVRIDSSGIGGGVVDVLLTFNPTYRVIEMNGNAASRDRKRYHNARAEFWDDFRLGLRAGTISLESDEPHAERLADELCSVEYKFNAQSGGLLIESKDDMRRRGIKSPDFADAAIYCAANIGSDDPLFGFNRGDKLRYGANDILGDDMPSYLNLMVDLYKSS